MYQIKLPSGEIKWKNDEWKYMEGKYWILLSRCISRKAFMNSDGSASESHSECNSEGEENSIIDLEEVPHSINSNM